MGGGGKSARAANFSNSKAHDQPMPEAPGLAEAEAARKAKELADEEERKRRVAVAEHGRDSTILAGEDQNKGLGQ